jgi:putative membrane protein
MDVHDLFSEADLEAIKAAVRDAEAQTSGEIVPYVVAQSDDYPTAVWKGAALGALLGPLVAVAIYEWGAFWGVHVPLWIALPAMVGGGAGYLLTAWLPPVRRWMAGEEVLEQRARRRAAVAFLEQEVFRTRDRTGILLFLSLFEHRVVVLGDTGINQKVKQEEWDGIAAKLAAGIRAGRPGAALLEAIRECGHLLERRGVALQPGDVNELNDELRRGES